MPKQLLKLSNATIKCDSNIAKILLKQFQLFSLISEYKDFALPCYFTTFYSTIPSKSETLMYEGNAIVCANLSQRLPVEWLILLNSNQLAFVM